MGILEVEGNGNGTGNDAVKAAAVGLRNLLEVVEYLKGAGWKVSKSAVYRHRDQGKVRPQVDGSFLVRDIEKYARVFLQRLDGSGKRVEQAPAELQGKQIAEVRKVSAQADHWEIKTRILRSEYVERTAFESALARRAAIFKSDIENFIRTMAGEVVNLVEGDPLLTPNLIDFWLRESEIWLNRYTEDREFDLPDLVDFQHLESIESVKG